MGKNRKTRSSGYGLDDVVAVGALLLVCGIVFGNTWFASPMYYSLTQICNEKYGVDGWTHSTISGYWTGAEGTTPSKSANYPFWVCDPIQPKDEVVCKLDGLGIKRCNQ